MAYREVTLEEMIKLADQFKLAHLWQSYRDYALKVYGPLAHKIEVETGSEYNDEGGSYATIEAVNVYDAEGNDLEPDLSLPFWQEADLDEYEPEDYAAEECSNLKAPEGDEYKYTFYVDKPLVGPRVFIEE